MPAVTFGAVEQCPKCIRGRGTKRGASGYMIVHTSSLRDSDWIIDRLPRGLIRIVCRMCDGKGIVTKF